MEELRNVINKILNEYIPAKEAPFACNPMRVFFQDEITQILYSTRIFHKNDYLTTV